MTSLYKMNLESLNSVYFQNQELVSNSDSDLADYFFNLCMSALKDDKNEWDRAESDERFLFIERLGMEILNKYGQRRATEINVSFAVPGSMLGCSTRLDGSRLLKDFTDFAIKDEENLSIVAFNARVEFNNPLVYGAMMACKLYLLDDDCGLNLQEIGFDDQATKEYGIVYVRSHRRQRRVNLSS